MSALTGHVRAALDKYQMLAPGDRIAVGVSGGKDSMYLLHALQEIARYHPSKFTVAAITVDPCFSGQETDYRVITDYCAAHGIPHHIRRTNIAHLVFSETPAANPCSLCARMRRGILHNICVASGYNKIALGHHLDDAVNTFLMNLFYGGKLGCFSPKTYLSRKDLTMIRPLIFCEEGAIVKQMRRLDLPVLKSPCPVDGKTARQDTAHLLADLSQRFPDLKAKIIGALQRGDLDGWGCS